MIHLQDVEELGHMEHSLPKILHLLINETDLIIAFSFLPFNMSLLAGGETFLLKLKCSLVIFPLLIVLSDVLVDSHQIT